MSTFVLVHGAWHGAWCWDTLKPLLKQEGHRVITPDLPCHGQDNQPLLAASLQGYTDSIVNIVQQQDEKVILVGHSMGGMVVSQVAEQIPQNIQNLAYICAFLLQDGESLLDVTQADTESLIMSNLIPQNDGSATLQAGSLKTMFFDSCTAAQAKDYADRLRPEPLAPVSTPINTTQENFGSLPKVYIECLHDRVISLEVQRKMQGAAPCEKVISLAADHSPYLSAPEELANALLELT